MIMEQDDMQCNFGRVREFTYLVVKIDKNGKADQEIIVRIAKGNREYDTVRRLITWKFVLRKLKERIYKTVI